MLMVSLYQMITKIFQRKHLILTCAIAMNLSLVQAQQTAEVPVRLTLDQIWDKASENNKQVRMQQLRVAGSAEEILDAKSERFPEINAEAEYGQVTNMPIYENGILHTPAQFPVIHTFYKVGGDAYLNLYNGKKTNTNISRQQTIHEIRSVQEEQTVSDVKLQAAAYYLDLQRSIAFKKLVKENIADEEHQLKDIKQLQKNGVVLKSDVLRIELQLSKQHLTLTQIDNDIAIANQKLNIIIGDPDEQSIIPTELSQDTAISIKSYQDYLDDALARSHENKISEGENELRKLELKNVKANLSPKLGLFANYGFNYPQTQFYPYGDYLYGVGMVGIKASFAIDALYHNRHKVKASEIELKTQELNHKHTQDQIRQGVKEAYLRYKESLNRIDVAQTNIMQARENARIVKNTYFNQLSLVTDLLESNTQLLQTEFDLAAAQIAAQLQYLQLQNIIGNL
jgi:outer membrane protein